MARNAEIIRKKRLALDGGGDPADVDELGMLLKLVEVEKRLIVILGRIYPIQLDGTIETDFDIPELHEFVHKYKSHKSRCKELRTRLLPGP